MSLNITMVLSVGIIILVIFILSYIILLFNNYITLKNLVDKSQSNIDVLLKQRFDELPNIINSIKGYMQYESELLLQITNQRTQIMDSNMNIKSKTNDQITNTLKSVFAVSENYPNLKANQNFLQLQERIISIENQISDRRTFYNDTVNNYNIWIESFPNSILTNLIKAKRKNFFETNDRNNVKVEL